MSLLDKVDRATPTASGRGRRPGELTRGAGLGLGIGVLWLSLLVLLPIAAIVSTAFDNGISGFWDAITDPEALSAITFTVGAAVLVTIVNAVIGTLIAWVLVRDDFPGKRILEVIIDIPFALPTIVAGLVLITLYGPTGPFGINLVGTKAGVVLALLFVTLPFVVRSVQPVLIDTDREVELAAASLGANGFTVFRRVILPTVTPAVVSGAALSFARALGEFGSVILISANLIGETQVSSSYILKMIESQEPEAAAAVATLLLGVAVLVLVLLDVVQRRMARRG